jgi:hypothetical protein
VAVVLSVLAMAAVATFSAVLVATVFPSVRTTSFKLHHVIEEASGNGGLSSSGISGSGLSWSTFCGWSGGSRCFSSRGRRRRHLVSTVFAVLPSVATMATLPSVFVSTVLPSMRTTSFKLHHVVEIAGSDRGLSSSGIGGGSLSRGSFCGESGGSRSLGSWGRRRGHLVSTVTVVLSMLAMTAVATLPSVFVATVLPTVGAASLELHHIVEIAGSNWGLSGSWISGSGLSWGTFCGGSGGSGCLSSRGGRGRHLVSTVTVVLSVLAMTAVATFPAVLVATVLPSVRSARVEFVKLTGGDSGGLCLGSRSRRSRRGRCSLLRSRRRGGGSRSTLGSWAHGVRLPAAFAVLASVSSMTSVSMTSVSVGVSMGTSLKVHVDEFTGLEIIRFRTLNKVTGFLRWVGECTAGKGKSSDQSNGRSSTHI